MRRLTIEIAAATALTLGAIISLASGANASDVMVSSAYARASAVSTAKAGSVYLTLMNHGSRPDRLIALHSDAARSASLHETVTDNGITSMREVKVLELAPGAVLELKPGGKHVMLTGLTGPLKQGSILKLTLVFETAGEIFVDVPIGNVAASAEDHSIHTGTSGN